jgi:hypothetical protein
MFAALRGTYVQFVVFMGVSERYPKWFIEEISNRVFSDDSRFCFWTPPPERELDYYEKELIEMYSIVVRKPDGSTHVMEQHTFTELYEVFQYNKSLNGGRAAFHEDIIEYVECVGGTMLDIYPPWFYEFFTECINHPDGTETYLLDIDGNGGLIIGGNYVVLRNKLGEVKPMLYLDFLKHYDPLTTCDTWWEECPF